MNRCRKFIDPSHLSHHFWIDLHILMSACLVFQNLQAFRLRLIDQYIAYELLELLRLSLQIKLWIPRLPLLIQADSIHALPRQLNVALNQKGTRGCLSLKLVALLPPICWPQPAYWSEPFLDHKAVAFHLKSYQASSQATCHPASSSTNSSSSCLGPSCLDPSCLAASSCHSDTSFQEA